ncbi:MAG: AAA family ATPase [Spirochaetaceae bacterium]|nr:AAA family ATPase [Spirochaetaceae bacterium]
MAPRKMPIGIQDFEDIRTNGYVYVDKTAYVYRLASETTPYFLTRPCGPWGSGERNRGEFR